MASDRGGVSIVIPAFDEVLAIEGTVREVRSVLEGAGVSDFEILVVDDGSQDGTGEAALRAGARVVRHPHNIGYGRSLKDGITAAQHDVIVITDSDGTYPIARIPELLAAYERGFDMVVGQRTALAGGDGVVKAPMRRILKFLVEFTSGRAVPDVNSGLRVFSRATVMRFFPQLCDTFSFTTSLTLAYMTTGRFVSYLPITYGRRIGTTKVRLFRESLRTLQYIVQSILYYNPIKMFLLMSVACGGAGLFVLLLAAVLKSSIAVLLGGSAILVSVLVFGLGLVSDLLRQIMTK